MCGLCNTACHVPKGLQHGVVIDAFVIEKLLGTGGMGNVYLAHQVSLDREVALKILHPQFLEDQKFLEEFVYEARSVASLNHPNIVQAYKVGEENGALFFAMEIVDGHNLNDILNKEGHITEKFAVDIAIEVTNALGYAWEKRQLVHRDIKPENIMITQDGHAKVMDLGLSRRDGDNFDDGDTISGTPQYISPEQILGTEIDIRSDFYSLGATLFHLVTGRFVFEAPQLPQMIQMHIQETPTSAKSLIPELSKEFSYIINKLLAKQPENRFQDAASLVKELQKARKLLKDQKRGVKHFNIKTQAVSKKQLSHKDKSAHKPRKTKSSRKTQTRLKVQDKQPTNKKLLFATIIVLIIAAISPFLLSSSSPNEQNQSNSSDNKITSTVKTEETAPKTKAPEPSAQKTNEQPKPLPKTNSKVLIPNSSQRFALTNTNFSQLIPGKSPKHKWDKTEKSFTSVTNGKSLKQEESSKIIYQMNVPQDQEYHAWIIGNFRKTTHLPIFIHVNDKRQYNLFEDISEHFEDKWTYAKLSKTISLKKGINIITIRNCKDRVIFNRLVLTPDKNFSLKNNVKNVLFINPDLKEKAEPKTAEVDKSQNFAKTYAMKNGKVFIETINHISIKNKGKQVQWKTTSTRLISSIPNDTIKSDYAAVGYKFHQKEASKLFIWAYVMSPKKADPFSVIANKAKAKRPYSKINFTGKRQWVKSEWPLHFKAGINTIHFNCDKNDVRFFSFLLTKDKNFDPKNKNLNQSPLYSPK